jgi:hypothetical protein
MEAILGVVAILLAQAVLRLVELYANRSGSAR